MDEKEEAPRETRQLLAELVVLCDEIHARTFALETLLEEQGLLSSVDMKQRAEWFRKELARIREAADPAEEIARLRMIPYKHEGTPQ